MQVNAAGQMELKLKTPWRDGNSHLVMTPWVFMRRLAALVPQGPVVQAQATEVAVTDECQVETVQAWPHRISWAQVLKRVCDIDMQHCPNCDAGELKIIAASLRGEAGQDFAA